ncbi:MAG: hypothetical protein ABEJ99_05040 [Candidatus Nanohaloarchaea archaeon]
MWKRLLQARPLTGNSFLLNAGRLSILVILAAAFTMFDIDTGFIMGFAAITLSVLMTGLTASRM